MFVLPLVITQILYTVYGWLAALLFTMVSVYLTWKCLLYIHFCAFCIKCISRKKICWNILEYTMQYVCVHLWIKSLKSWTKTKQYCSKLVNNKHWHLFYSRCHRASVTRIVTEIPYRIRPDPALHTCNSGASYSSACTDLTEIMITIITLCFYISSWYDPVEVSTFNKDKDITTRWKWRNTSCLFMFVVPPPSWCSNLDWRPFCLNQTVLNSEFIVYCALSLSILCW